MQENRKTSIDPADACDVYNTDSATGAAESVEDVTDGEDLDTR